MKNPFLFWAIMCLVYITAYSFLIDITPEEHRYIDKAQAFLGANFQTQLMSGSFGYYALFSSISTVFNSDIAIRILRFLFLLVFFGGALLVLEKANRLNYLLILMLFPSFIGLIFSQSKNIFAFGLFIYFLVKKDKPNWEFWFILSIIGSLAIATFAGIQITFILLFYLVMKEKLFENNWKYPNLIMLGFFVILNIAYWGFLGFNQFEPVVHEEVGLLTTVLMLAVICIFDHTLIGSLSLVMGIVLFLAGQPYWAYRPLELMAINAVLNGRVEIGLKSLASLIPHG